MFFRRKTPKADPHILRIQIEVDLYAYTQFIRSGRETVATDEGLWTGREAFEYEIQVLPSVNGDWYFHRTAGEFAHTVAAIIELDEFVGLGLSPELAGQHGTDLELSWWNEMLHLSLGSKSIALVPINEAGVIARTGCTSLGSRFNPVVGTEEVPVAFESVGGKAIKTELINRHLGGDGAIYWNNVCRVVFDSPTRGVVVRSKA